MTVWSIDANSVYARAWFAVNKGEEKFDDSRSDLTSAQNTMRAIGLVLTHAARDIGKPDALVFCWDGKSKSDKARKPKPEGFEEDLVLVRQWMPEFTGCPQYDSELEADDAVATVAINAKEAGDDCVVLSSDKDLRQLIGKSIRYFDIRVKHLLTAEDVRQRFGIHKPSHLAVYLAVVGDPGDGITGVPKFGPKKFAKIYEAVEPHHTAVEAMDIVMGALDLYSQKAFESCLCMTTLNTSLPDAPVPKPLNGVVPRWAADTWRWPRPREERPEEI